MTTMTPGRIRAKLLTSVKLGKHSVSLDGLLWHCLYAHTASQSRATDKLSDYLSESHGIFKASSMSFGVQESGQLYATNRTTVGAMRATSDLGLHWFHPNGKNGKYKNLVMEGGPMRNRFVHHKTYKSEQVVWDLVGHGQRICDLLNFYVSCVGMEVNHGFGMVEKFVWEESEEDLSWFDSDNRPTRLLSLDVYEALGMEIPAGSKIVSAKPCPPYRDEQLVKCVAPQRIRTTLVSTL
jgi:hypothetical protein